VSGLLGDKPIVFSGRGATFKPGKDTGRYWNAGAANVHWVVGTDNQMEAGLAVALERVQAAGAFIEGNSFLKFTEVDYSIMVANPLLTDIKSSALAILPKVKALFITQEEPEQVLVDGLFERLKRRGARKVTMPVYFGRDWQALCEEINRIKA
jgi:hypothetical protein